MKRKQLDWRSGSFVFAIVIAFCAIFAKLCVVQLGSSNRVAMRDHVGQEQPKWYVAARKLKNAAKRNVKRILHWN